MNLNYPTYSQRLDAFVKLGHIFKQVAEDNSFIQKAFVYNNWFTPSNQVLAIQALGNELSFEKLQNWTKAYPAVLAEKEPKRVAIIMAGNIPLVGFHDLLSVLISGHIALVKPSSDDEVLLKWVIDELISIEPLFANQIEWAKEGKLKEFDAVIATGSNNSHRYFEQYFKNKKSLLRKNRNSIAVLHGNETHEQLEALADDVFRYFGLGCRNVSKVFWPKGYFPEPVFKAFEKYADIIHHHKYANNYTYHKAIFLMNQTKHLDNNFILVKEDEKLASPLGVLLFQEYETQDEISNWLIEHKDEIQCVVGEGFGLDFGQSQCPTLSDYADGVDTLAFLSEL